MRPASLSNIYWVFYPTTPFSSFWASLFMIYCFFFRGIRNPEDYFYIKTLALAMKIKSSWPTRELGHYESETLLSVMKFLHVFLSIVSLFGGFMYIKLHFSSLPFFELGHLYICMLMNLVFFSRILTLCLNQKYRDVARDFLTKFHLFFYKDLSEYAMKTHIRMHLISHRYTLCLTGQMIIGILLFNFVPMYNNYAAGNYDSNNKNISYEHSIYYSYPFDVTTNWKGYIVANLVNWVVSYFCSSWFCMCDLFLSLMVFHTYGHFKILLNKLNTFPRPANKTNMFVGSADMNYEMFDEHESEKVFDLLSDCINYHRHIVNFIDRLSNVFGPMLLVYYIFHQTTGCLLLLECSQMTAAALIRYLPLTIIIFQQLIQLSVIFEIIGSESDKLSDAVYGLPWECMDDRNRKMVGFLLMNVQEPVHVVALGVANVGVTSMATILKTSMSYFTFLRSTQ
ncbi:odorant receptor 13a-like [Trichoplusia ni]|uniref:Odorant receptor n=1 Tax=Trichoplusia ni TaxID=7111 RepID=A0A7E5W929_TRINI|nr:odorant receptor 13a-like [Trichoplusia ni]